MNIISNFLVSDILKMLEEQFVSHETELQEAFLSEVGVLCEKMATWLTHKISDGVSDEEK